MSALMMNGTNLNSAQSMSGEDSEESFVVLSPSLAPDNMETIMSVNSSMVNSMNNVPQMPSMSKELCDAINAMSVSATSELSADEIHSKLESLLHENIQLKETLHQNNLAMKKQFTTLVAWQEDVMKVHQSHKEKFEETKKLISHLRAENMELKKSTSLPPQIASTSENETEIINLKSNISALEFELDTLRKGFIKNQAEQNAKSEELQTKLTNMEKEKDENINSLNMQVNNLKTELSSTLEKLNVAQKRVLEMADKLPTVSALETIDKMNKEILELNADLHYKNQVLQEKADLLDKLMEENKKLKSDNETIFIYKTQVEQYQQDFNAERQARNAIHEEKERIAEDLRHLHRRNEELIVEIERLRRDGFVELPSASSIPREQTPPPPQYICPMCSSVFKTSKLLQQHCDHCIS